MKKILLILLIFLTSCGKWYVGKEVKEKGAIHNKKQLKCPKI